MPSSSDRYYPNPLDDAVGFAEWQRKIEQQVAQLQGAPITGTIRVRDIGGGYDVFHVDERGMDTPQFPLPANFAGGGNSTTGTNTYLTIPNGVGDFGIAARFIMPVVLAHTAVRILIGYQFTSGSTGRLRAVSRKRSGGSSHDLATTTSGTLAGTGSTSQNLDWLHQIPLGVPDKHDEFTRIDIEGVVNTGAGELRVFEPRLVLVNDTYGATEAGVWTAV